MNTTSLQHSVLPRHGEFWVVYPTPGLPDIPTLVVICSTEQQAQSEAARLNGSLQ